MDFYSIRKRIKHALRHTYGAVYEHDVCFILRHCFGIKSCWDSGANVDDVWVDAVARAIEQYWPIQYVCGVEEFRNNIFYVFPDVFIPREETEVLVDIAKDIISGGARVLDIGIGTGVIGLSLLVERSDISVVGVDINPISIVNAHVNARRMGCLDRINLWHGDIFKVFSSLGKVDFIVSNPPYLPSRDMYTVDLTVKKEPDSALYGGEIGIEFIVRLIDLLIGSGYSGGFLFEFDFTTKDQLNRLLKTKVFSVKYYRDLVGKERFALIWL